MSELSQTNILININNACLGVHQQHLNSLLEQPMFKCSKSLQRFTFSKDSFYKKRTKNTELFTNNRCFLLSHSTKNVWALFFIKDNEREKVDVESLTLSQ